MKRVIGLVVVCLVPVTMAFAGERPRASAKGNGFAAEELLVPRVAKDQTRPSRPVKVIGNPEMEKDIDTAGGPGPGNSGAGNCQNDTLCKTRLGYSCREYAGFDCYTWVNSDGYQRCAACP
jgi:hypothetical protein